jgi:hypothetical protein
MDWLVLALVSLGGGLAGIVFMCLLFVSKEASQTVARRGILPAGEWTGML